MVSPCLSSSLSSYGAAGVALTTIAPTLGAFLDGTFASSVSYRVVADGVDAIAQTSVVPSGQTLSLAINKTVKILEIIIHSNQRRCSIQQPSAKHQHQTGR